MKKFKGFICLLIILSLVFSSSTLISKGFDEPITTQSDEKVIYLTFDDGPAGKVTENVLNTLKKHDIKATFFLIGSQIKGQEDILKRMVDEGHTLGLHSMTHNRDSLYSSNAGFIKEMKATQDVILQATNIKATVLRFPFGCNNSTYKLKESLVNTIHDNGMKIYDWNLDSGDGANSYASPDTFINKSCSSNKNEIVLLMHCGYINKNSAIALEPIIKHYKNKGYTFKAITEDTPEVYHYYKK